MIGKLKKLTVQLLLGANSFTIALLLLAGYSDQLYPVDHPLLSVMGMAFPVFLLINGAFLVVWLIFKWTKAWLPVLGFVLAYVPIRIYYPIHYPETVPDDAVKLVSYNVCAYIGNKEYADELDKICDYLKAGQPDIVCLQEDIDEKHKGRFDALAKIFPHNDTVALCPNVVPVNYIGIHTRYPIIRRERIQYKSRANGSVAWWLKVNGDTLIVINNHFESCHLNLNDRQQYQQILKGTMPGDSVRAESKLLLVKLAEANALRAPQIDRVCQYVKEHPGYPLVVCGDFNDTPISYSRRAMSQLLTDCYVETGRGLGISYNREGFFFRIDHLFCSEQIRPYNCEIDTKIDASDHYPLVCSLKIGVKP